MQFFREDNGNLSMMRLMCFMAVCAAIGLAFCGASDIIVGMFLTFAGAGKLAQKIQEKGAFNQ